MRHSPTVPQACGALRLLPAGLHGASINSAAILSAHTSTQVLSRASFAADATIYIVDDEFSMRRALSSLMRSVSLDCEAFATAQDFLDAPEPGGPACIVLDMRLLDNTGFDVQAAINQRRRRLPVIFLTGYGTIPMTVRAMKAGASAFLTKPFIDHELLDAIRSALQADRAAMALQRENDALLALYQRLTPRERQVMGRVVCGLLNKQIAAELGISEITIKVHRRQVMAKMQAGSLPDLVRMSERLAAVQRGA
ncbi:MAG: response regulator [Comamonas sp.]